MRALVLAGGALAAVGALRGLAQGADVIVAADSGLRHALALGVTPDLLVGDFDSVAAADLERFPHLERRTFPANKDALDLELALAAACERGARELALLGALGGRLDQTLAALFIALRWQREGYELALHDGARSVYPLVGPVRRSLELPVGTRLSLLSPGPSARLSVSGARWTLADETLPFGVGRGVSNEVARSPLMLELHAGEAVLVLEAVDTEGADVQDADPENTSPKSTSLPVSWATPGASGS